MQIQISFSLDEINQLLQILGQTPSSSGAFPYMVKLRQQAEQVIQASKIQPEVSPIQPMPPPQNFQAERNAELGRQIMSQGF